MKPFGYGSTPAERHAYDYEKSLNPPLAEHKDNPEASSLNSREVIKLILLLVGSVGGTGVLALKIFDPYS